MPRQPRHWSAACRGALAAAATAFAAPAPAAPPAEPTVDFTVSPKDTLIGLSTTVFTSPAAWREVAALNRLPNPNRLRPGQVLQVPARLLRSQAVPATLAVVEGEVRIDGTAATAGAVLREGQTIETMANGAAAVVLSDGTRLRLPPASLAEVIASRRYADRAGTTAVGADDGAAAVGGFFAGALRLLRGSVEVFATKVLRAKPLELVTPTAVIGVRGTQFRVGINDAARPSSRVEVLEGATQLALPAQPGPGTPLPGGFGSRIDEGTAVPAVVPLLPAPDLSAVPVLFERPVVRFRLAGDALRVQVASDAAFDHLVGDQLIAAGDEIRIAGLPDGAWFVRARRLDPQAIEGLDANRRFVLKARPEPPPVSRPPQRAKQSVGAVAFAWLGSVDKLGYRLQVARDAAFRELLLDRSGLDDNGLQLDIDSPGSYHWRVASIAAGNDQGPFGDPQQFELRPLPTPPEGGLSDDGSTLALRWSGRPEDRQQAELSRDAGFTRIVAQAELSAPQWAIDTPRWPGTYYFRYRSVEPDGFVSPYSGTLKIEVPFDKRALLLLLPLLLIGL